MNDKQFFLRYQPQILGLANTSEGRDLLGIDQGVPTVIEVMPWYVKWLIGQGEYQTEFHVYAVFFRRVMHRWKEVSAAMEWQANSFLARRGGHLLVPAGSDTLTARPDADTESSTVDGMTGFQGLPDGGVGRQTFANARGDDGSTYPCCTRDAQAYIGLGMGYRGGGGGGWEDFQRGFHLYDTSSIGSNTVTAAVNSWVCSQASTTLSELTWCIVSSSPASNTAIVAGDYDSCGTTDFGNIEADALNTDGSSYNAVTLNSDGRAAIDRAGITKFGWRHDGDRSNTEPGGLPGSGAESATILLRSADESGTSIDPKLVVTHAVASDIDNVNGIALASIEEFNDVTAANGQAIYGADF